MIAALFFRPVAGFFPSTMRLIIRVESEKLVAVTPSALALKVDNGTGLWFAGGLALASPEEALFPGGLTLLCGLHVGGPSGVRFAFELGWADGGFHLGGPRMPRFTCGGVGWGCRCSAAVGL